jgi:Uma2 family endonuclease
MSGTQPNEQRMTRDEYIRLSEEGYFQDRRVQLIGGEVIEMPAQKNLHAMGVSLVQNALQQAFGPNYWARGQATLNLSPVSVPDPDVAVIAGAIRTHNRAAIPTTALLVVEVSETTLAFDQTRKASLYAAAGIEDYWVLNLIDSQLEVYRYPQADPAQPFGYAYANVVILGPADYVTPLALPAARIPVVDLLP